MNRLYTSRRRAIAIALAGALEAIDGTDPFLSEVAEVHPKSVFWDDLSQWPSITVTPGSESREYQGGGYKDRFLAVTIRIYVNEDDAQEKVENLIEDVETVLEDNSRLAYTDNQGNTQYTQLITIVSIDTDEGLLEPYGIGEILVEVRY